MQYISTRGGGERVSGAEAIFRGLAPDGGLYLPESIPSLTPALFHELCGLDYIGRAERILGLFLDDYTPDEISSCVRGAYQDGFQDNCPAPLAKLSEGTYLLELWHGPTCAFKDMALQLLPGLLTTAMAKVGGGKEAVILVATSGDTGKAALEGFRDVPGTRILVYYPQEGVSTMQRRQMETQQGGNVWVTGVRGNFDDTQNGVKAIFGDQALREELAKKNLLLTSANSINWGRLLPQIVYYISAYCGLVTDGELGHNQPVNFCVPTGNFGNILAAHYARRMGLPIGKLLCASNRNKVLTDCIRTGIYDRNRPFYCTSSPSMDILISSNLERLLFELCGSDGAAVAALQRDLAGRGRFVLPDQAVQTLDRGFWAGFCDEQGTADTIREVFTRCSYLLDTHTAVAVQVAGQYQAATQDTTPMVIVSTASPFKFPRSVLEALGIADLPDDDFALARLLADRTGTDIPGPIAELEQAPRRFEGVCAGDEMTAALRAFLNR